MEEYYSRSYYEMLQNWELDRKKSEDQKNIDAYSFEDTCPNKESAETE